MRRACRCRNVVKVDAQGRHAREGHANSCSPSRIDVDDKLIMGGVPYDIRHGLTSEGINVRMFAGATRGFQGSARSQESQSLIRTRRLRSEEHTSELQS